MVYRLDAGAAELLVIGGSVVQVGVQGGFVGGAIGGVQRAIAERRLHLRAAAAEAGQCSGAAETHQNSHDGAQGLRDVGAQAGAIAAYQGGLDGLRGLTGSLAATNLGAELVRERRGVDI